MKPAELEHIADDIRTAVLEAWPDGDLLVAHQIRTLLFVEVAKLALNPIDVTTGRKVQAWAEELLRACQLRAVSKVPFGEPTNDAAPHILEHL